MFDFFFFSFPCQIVFNDALVDALNGALSLTFCPCSLSCRRTARRDVLYGESRPALANGDYSLATFHRCSATRRALTRSFATATRSTDYAYAAPARCTSPRRLTPCASSARQPTCACARPATRGTRGARAPPTSDAHRAPLVARLSAERRRLPHRGPRPHSRQARRRRRPGRRRAPHQGGQGNSFCTLTLEESQLLGPGWVEDTINQLLEDDSDIEAAI
jgi:hypothetical protein